MLCKRYGILAILLLATAGAGAASKIQRETLASYVERMQQRQPVLVPSSPGSLWVDDGRLANLAADYKAAHVGDVISILVVQDVQADNSGNVSSDRSFKASSGLDALAGQLKTTAVQNLFAPHSSSTLAGKAAASPTSSVRTTLSGRVVAVLANGTLVIEAERQITTNNEKQTILLRGLVRPGDVSFDNRVSSNAIGDLELELKGKGVISDGTRRPNALIRLLLRIANF